MGMARSAGLSMDLSAAMSRHKGRRLYFLRHGQTQFNVEGRLQGQCDEPLNARGRDQATAIGGWLGAHRAIDMARLSFWSSPLVRAAETMERARVAMGLPADGYHRDARLMEISFGEWEGLTWPEIEARDAQGVYAREADKWGYTPPGGESYIAITERVARWLDDTPGDLFAVGHGGTGRAFYVLLAGMDPEIAVIEPVPQGRAALFENGAFRWIG